MDDGGKFIVGVMAFLLFMGLLVVVMISGSQCCTLYEADHKILATQISALHADVHALQTQITGKQ